MADNKKYYYMRLKENFFDTDEMLYLEGLEEGYLFSNILLKLYLRSLKNDGVLMMNEAIPYDARMISKFTGHSLSTVEKALFEFKKLKLIEVLDSGQMYMSNIELFVGKASTEADRKREARKNIQKKMEIGTNVGQMSDKHSPEKELELEIEKEKELNNKTVPDKSETEKILNDLFEKWYNIYDHKKGRPKAFSAFKTCLQTKKYDIGTLIDKTYEYINGEGLDKKYRKHPSTFLNQYHPDDDYTRQNGNVNKPKNNFMEALNEQTGSSNFINNDSKLLSF